MTVRIYYKEGYRFQLWRDVGFQTEIYPLKDIITEYIELHTDGYMIMKFGYAWDGPSGPCRWIADRLPAWLRKKYLRKIISGSLFHDGGCQLIRMKLLAPVWRKQIDKEFKKINTENKMFGPRIWWTYEAVENCGDSHIDPKNERPILIAP